jgi:hypothetical protein
VIFRSRRRGRSAGGEAAAAGSALAEPSGTGSVEELLAELERLAAERRAGRNPGLDSQLLALRHRAGLALRERGAAAAECPAPDFEALGENPEVPEVTGDELSAEVLRAGVLSGGCLLVRGLIDRDAAAGFRAEMERAFAAREAAKAGEGQPDGYFQEFVPAPGYDLSDRFMVSDPNGMWVVDSPKVAGDWFELLDGAGFLRVAEAYLGEHPAISVHKSTLRRVKADPNADYSLSHWHQDGAFMGQVRALNIWLSLSRCGDVAPGLDLVPRRLDEIVPTGTEGAVFDWSVSQKVAEESAGDAGVRRPIFEPGDALLFDDLFLHATGASPQMTEARYAVECWFFAPSAFPAEYPPLAS